MTESRSAAGFLAELELGLATKWLGRPTVVHPTLGSTQDEAGRLAATGAPAGTVVVALEQTAGRGRVDRAWHSPAGGGLWFTAILRPDLKPQAAARLGIVAGVGVAEALRAAHGADLRLKWPNDLRRDGRKVGGILAEAVLEGDQLKYALLGVGINLVAPLGGFPDDLKYVAAAVADDAPVPSPPATLAAVLAAIESRYDEYLSDGFAPARQAWLELSDTIGRYVQAHTHHGLIKGMATGLDGEGNLLVEPEEGAPVAVSVGEVIHLR